MKREQVLEWVDGTIGDSKTFPKLAPETQSALREFMIRAVEKVQDDRGIDFASVFLIKLSKDMRRTNWLWVQTTQWPYAKWNMLKKAAYRATMESLGIQPDQVEIEFGEMQ